MYFVYILENLAGNFYVGQTANLKERLKRHNGNRCGFTKNKGPWQLIYFEEFANRGKAMERESYIKSQKSKNFIEDLIFHRGVE